MVKNANAKRLVFISANSGYITAGGSAGDRSGPNAWHNGNALAVATANVYPNTTAIIHSIGQIIMEKGCCANVKAIILANLSGQEAGSALVDVPSGDISPSRKLPCTLKQASDCGSCVATVTSGSGAIPSAFTERLYVDYKYSGKDNITLRYRFGFGLSYTTFAFSGLKIALVKTLAELPPARNAKLAAPIYSIAIPAATRVACLQPAAFTTRIDKYT